MSEYRTRLRKLTRGDSWTINTDVKADGSPVTLDANYGAWLTLKEHPDDADSAAVLQLKSTLVGGDDAQAAFILNTNTGFTNRIQFNATAAQTAAMPNRLRTLYFDVQLLLPSGGIKTIDKGTVTVGTEITQDT